MKNKIIFNFLMVLLIPFLLSSCGKNSGGSKLNIVEIEDYILGEWSDPSCWVNFYQDKSFSLQINQSNYQSDVTELKGDYEVVSSKAIIFYIKQGRYKGMDVYSNQLSAGLKILEIVPEKKELYVKGYINNEDFIVSRLVKK